ncbi:NAD(P)H-dependent oxidoreductase subunit E [Archangium violaceum]|uniref:CbiX/SirB N-terminal domain-containing protein n=1 Tax=Archangium violaceum TaxID=83451 RepID=UPI00193C80D2|nr:CbiX/SirB N-terminal domain-containing protein [Archangium violaceum]QRK06622.1 NAD(P)H-dependent oxidoreductase subunit E [Archangium violaceum]
MSTPQTRRGILFIGHGSRDEQAIAEVHRFVDAYREAHPELPVRLGFVELTQPALPEALDAIASEVEEVLVVPLFLFTAKHVKNDIPLALATARKNHPGVRFLAVKAFGVHPDLAQLAFERTQARTGQLSPQEAARTVVVMLGRGSSDPDANGDFYKLTRLYAERKGFAQVQPAFAGIAKPSLEEALEWVARARPERILVMPYLLFTGILLQKMHAQVALFAERYPWLRAEVAPHLADGSLLPLVEHVDRRIEEALAGGVPLPCDGCQYRVPLAGLQENVGGLKALLWSIRHRETHTQAAPHPHAHRAMEKHVLVCGNADCADRGSVALIEALRRKLKEVGKGRTVRITRTACMGRCGEGPTVAVYPDGIWYRGVTEADAREIVDEHLVGDRLVSRLVDNIMQ